MKLNVYKILFVFLFLPSITFNIVPAEVFPWGIIFALYCFRLEKSGFYFLLTLTVYSVFALIFVNEYYDYQEIVRIYASYLNPLVALFALIYCREISLGFIKKIARVLFNALLIFGILQYSNVIAPISDLLSALVSRGTFTHEGTSRGVSLLSTEPARAAIELLVLYAIVRNGYKRKVIFDALFIVFQVLILKSATGLIFSLLYVQVMWLQERRFALFSAVNITVILGLGSLISFSPGNRALSLISTIVQSDLSSAMNFLVSTSGPRVFSYFIIPEFILQYPFSVGFGNWKLASEIATHVSSYDYSSMNWFLYHEGSEFRYFRPPGFLPNLIFDLGITAFIFAVWLSFLVRKYGYFRNKKMESWFFLLLYLLTGSPGSPVIFLYIVYRSRNSRNIE